MCWCQGARRSGMKGVAFYLFKSSRCQGINMTVHEWLLAPTRLLCLSRKTKHLHRFLSCNIRELSSKLRVGDFGYSPSDNPLCCSPWRTPNGVKWARANGCVGRAPAPTPRAPETGALESLPVHVVESKKFATDKKTSRSRIVSMWSNSCCKNVLFFR